MPKHSKADETTPQQDQTTDASAARRERGSIAVVAASAGAIVVATTVMFTSCGDDSTTTAPKTSAPVSSQHQGPPVNPLPSKSEDKDMQKKDESIPPGLSVVNPKPDRNTPVGAVGGFLSAYYQDRDGERAADYFSTDVSARKISKEIEQKIPEPYKAVSFTATTTDNPAVFYVNVVTESKSGRVITVNQVMTVAKDRDGHWRVQNITVQQPGQQSGQDTEQQTIPG